MRYLPVLAWNSGRQGSIIPAARLKSNSFEDCKTVGQAPKVLRLARPD
jgi:hypothetical protein